LRKGRNKNVITTIKGKALGQIIQDIHNPYSIFIPGLSGIPAFEELKSEGVIRRAAVKGDANIVFRNILWLLKQNEEKWMLFTKDLTDIFPGLEIGISFDKIKDEYLDAFIISNSKKLPIDSFGTGVLQIIQILSYIYLYSPKILILDEPDSHLHPSNQQKLAEKLNDITSRLNFQAIISTHSRHLLVALRDNAAVNWISNGQLNPDNYDFISVLMEISALDRGDILNKGNIKCVVFTEDNKTKKLETILVVNGFDLSQTEIWAYNGCSKLDTAIIIAAFIKKNAPATQVLIHRDRDYLSDAECDDIKAAANAAHLEIMFTIGTDIESNLINESHISKAYPDLDIDTIRELINQATDECETLSIENFINTATALALKTQYTGGSKVNSGQIATTCIAEYKANKPRYRHEKKGV
jgi:energy-coupling factor transporter ATP-binding protein EcfA2